MYIGGITCDRKVKTSYTLSHLHTTIYLHRRFYSRTSKVRESALEQRCRLVILCKAAAMFRTFFDRAAGVTFPVLTSMASQPQLKSCPLHNLRKVSAAKE